MPVPHPHLVELQHHGVWLQRLDNPSHFRGGCAAGRVHGSHHVELEALSSRIRPMHHPHAARQVGCEEAALGCRPHTRGLHSFTFQLKLSGI
jgi:hypothetical protein